MQRTCNESVLSTVFCRFTKSKGNDLSTPGPSFPGLVDGDSWCLCALRWKEALDAGKAPPVNLEATYKSAIEYVTLEDFENKATPDSTC